MTKSHKIAVLGVTICSSFLFGYVSSSSNLFGRYPSFESKVVRPSKPFSKDEYALNRYKREVKQYLEDANDYVTAANNDIDAINRASKLAIDNANEVVAEYNRFVQSGY